MIRFVATARWAEDIKPGEAFSRVGPEFWDSVMVENPLAVGQKVYLRTYAPTPRLDVGTRMYVITVEDPEP